MSEFSPQCLKPTVKYPTKVMVWGCMSSHDVGRLHIVSGTVKTWITLKILQNKLLPTARSFWESVMDFQDDNAPCHRAKGAHAYAYSSAISFPNVSVSSVIENSSYDLPYVKNFNTRNDSSSLIKDYKYSPHRSPWKYRCGQRVRSSEWPLWHAAKAKTVFARRRS
ncbi:hypothetical protein TNCV_4543461 [Trichonephila clavipes]|nr:hypothetical protein TNCV_4543461 [Trichonephila clavipes]